MVSVLLLAVALASAAEVPQEPAPPVERLDRSSLDREWRRNKTLSSAGLVAGYASSALGLVATAALIDDSPEALPAVFGGQALVTAGSTGLLYAGARGNARWLEDQGVDLYMGASTFTLGLGATATAAGGAGAVMAAVGADDQDTVEVAALLGFPIQGGFMWQALGVGIGQLYVNGDALRTRNAGPGGPLPAAFGTARTLAFAGAVLGWVATPLYVVATLGSGADSDAARIATSGAAMTAVVVGPALLAVGTGWQQGMLTRSGYRVWRGGAVLGYVMVALGALAMMTDLATWAGGGEGGGPGILGTVVLPVGMGALTARLVIHDRARRGTATASLPIQLAPYATPERVGLALSGSF